MGAARTLKIGATDLQILSHDLAGVHTAKAAEVKELPAHGLINLLPMWVVACWNLLCFATDDTSYKGSPSGCECMQRANRGMQRDAHLAAWGPHCPHKAGCCAHAPLSAARPAVNRHSSDTLVVCVRQLSALCKSKQQHATVALPAQHTELMWNFKAAITMYARAAVLTDMTVYDMMDIACGGTSSEAILQMQMACKAFLFRGSM